MPKVNTRTPNFFVFSSPLLSSVQVKLEATTCKSPKGSKHFFTIFFSKKEKQDASGRAGDVWLCSVNFVKIYKAHLASETRANIKCYLDSVSIWYHDHSAWVAIEHDDIVALKLDTEHPLSPSLRLDFNRLTWRSPNSLTSTDSKQKRRLAKGAKSSGQVQLEEELKAGEGVERDDREESEDDTPIDVLFEGGTASEEDAADDEDDVDAMRLSIPVFANGWILDLLQRFKSPPISSVHPNQAKGVEVLKLLANVKHPLTKTPASNSKVFVDFQKAKWMKKKPTFQDVMEELRTCPASTRLVDHFKEVNDEELTGAQVADFMAQMENNGWQEGDPLLGVLSLDAPRLVEKCQPAFPASLDPRRKSIFHYASEGTTASANWSATATAMSAITSCHLDELAMAIYFHHVFGNKLWMGWPADEQNLSIYLSWYHTFGDNLPLSEAITRLHGLEVLLVDNEQVSWSFPPATLHAVVTFSPTSAHIGFYWIHSKDLEQSQTAIKCLLERLNRPIAIDDFVNRDNWAASLDAEIASQRAETTPLKISVKGKKEVKELLVDTERVGLACWEELAERVGGRLKNEIQNWTETTRNAILETVHRHSNKAAVEAAYKASTPRAQGVQDSDNKRKRIAHSSTSSRPLEGAKVSKPSFKSNGSPSEEPFQRKRRH